MSSVTAFLLKKSPQGMVIHQTEADIYHAHFMLKKQHLLNYTSLAGIAMVVARVEA